MFIIKAVFLKILVTIQVSDVDFSIQKILTFSVELLLAILRLFKADSVANGGFVAISMKSENFI